MGAVGWEPGACGPSFPSTHYDPLMRRGELQSEESGDRDTHPDLGVTVNWWGEEPTYCSDLVVMMFF